MGLVSVPWQTFTLRARGKINAQINTIWGLFPLPRPVLLDYVINRIIT